jgi:serine/threonine protein kinase
VHVAVGADCVHPRACGALITGAPETIRQEEQQTASDWWSVGVVVAYVATGVHPFQPAASSAYGPLDDRPVDERPVDDRAVDDGAVDDRAVDDALADPERPTGQQQPPPPSDDTLQN